MLAAFGRPAQAACTLLIFIITFLTPVAYLILLRGLLSPIIEAYITHRALSPLAKHLVISLLALLVTPLSTFQMGAIGSLAVLSMGAIAVLAAVVGLRGYQCMLDKGSPSLPAVGVDHFGILGRCANAPLVLVVDSFSLCLCVCDTRLIIQNPEIPQQQHPHLCVVVPVPFQVSCNNRVWIDGCFGQFVSSITD